MSITRIKRQPQAQRKKRFINRIPREGEDGLFSQSWFAICKSDEVKCGEVIGKPFLDGKVVVYRGANGIAKVMSAYCPHVGTDLSRGYVAGDNLQCQFHRWEFDQEGRCVKTGIGDPPPPNACLFNFPTVERFGVIMAFNGEEPLWNVPDFCYPDDELVWEVTKLSDYWDCDPWVINCNTPDWQHFTLVHNFSYGPEVIDEIEFTDIGLRYTMRPRLNGPTGEQIVYNVEVSGTGIFSTDGTFRGKWFAMMMPHGLPMPGKTEVYGITFAHNPSKTEAGAREAMAQVKAIGDVLGGMVWEDERTLNGIHYQPGALTRHDRGLAKFLEILRKFPRAHPSRDFIR
jgi:phenylpropionate dioxygenase-like ring-hydroxylating dioxygenase large terminal subunit